LAVGGVLLAFLVGTAAMCGRARAQAAAGGSVLDQVPDNALVVLKIKNLGQTNKKVAKFSKELGLDQQEPALADPLGALKQALHLNKGLNEAGDAAVFMVDPGAAGGDPGKAVVILMPVSDYKAFVGNFQNPAVEGEVTHVKAGDGGQDTYVAQWGSYAAVAQAKELLGKKPAGLKLQGAAAREADAKDVIVIANIPAVKALALPELKNNREKIMQEVDQAIAKNGAGAEKFGPLAKVVVGQVLTLAEDFLNDARSVSVGLNLTDAGVVMTAFADFKPESKLGKIVAQSKSTEGPLVTGLPANRKYFVVAGGAQDPQTAGRVLADFLDPVKKELAKIPEAKSVSQLVDAWQKAASSVTGYSMGYAVPAGQPGAESLLQEVAVIQGDPASLQSLQQQSFAMMTDMMKNAPKNAAAGPQPEVTIKEGSRTVAGAKFAEHQIQIKFPGDAAKDPQVQQAQQVMGILLGKDHAGLTTLDGAVGPKTYLMVQGGGDDLVAEAVAAAKANQPLAEPANIKAVAAQLPKARSSVAYVELDAIVNTAVRYTKTMFPLNAKAMPDLPPIGMSAGNEQSAARVDVAIPMDLVKGMVSWSIETKRANEANGPGGGL